MQAKLFRLYSLIRCPVCGLKIHKFMIIQVVGGKMTDLGRLGAFITKVKKGSLADVVGHLRAGNKINYS